MMLMSNAKASQILCEYGATACTDITGFGLLGHLAEMVEASKVRGNLLLPQENQPDSNIYLFCTTMIRTAYLKIA